MAVSLKHSFQSAKGDGTDATLVQPSNWNAEHTITCAANAVLGRGATSGAVTELACNSVGRDVLAAADAAGARTAMGAASATDVSGLLARQVIAGNGLTGGGTLNADRTLTVSFASTSQWQTATQYAVLEAKTVWDAMAEVALNVTDATIPWDMSTGFDFSISLAANRTLGAPTNAKVGQKGRLVVIQDSTGGRTLAWNSAFKFANGVDVAVSTSASAVDVFYYDVRATSPSLFIIVTLAGRAFA